MTKWRQSRNRRRWNTAEWLENADMEYVVNARAIRKPKPLGHRPNPQSPGRDQQSMGSTCHAFPEPRTEPADEVGEAAPNHQRRTPRANGDHRTGAWHKPVLGEGAHEHPAERHHGRAEVCPLSPSKLTRQYRAIKQAVASRTPPRMAWP